MGNQLNLFKERIKNIFIDVPKDVLMVGLNQSGKTTMLYQLKLNELISSIPTIGFNQETILCQNNTLRIWDLGGQIKIRNLWRHYYQNQQAIIFVVDSQNPEDISEAKDCFNKLLQEKQLMNLPFLIFVNKYDNFKLSVNDVSEIFELDSIQDRDWFIQGSCSIDGEGLKQGLYWLSQKLDSY